MGKFLKTKQLAVEVLPNRMVKPNIVPGNQLRRMGNYYKKDALVEKGDATGPDAIIVMTAVGRAMGKA